MAHKFIVTRRGILRLDRVTMHRDLLQPADSCMGGGFWQADASTNRLVLSGRSYDFGEPMWAYLCASHISLKVPSCYRGWAIVYHPDDPNAPDLRLNEEMTVEYI